MPVLPVIAIAIAIAIMWQSVADFFLKQEVKLGMGTTGLGWSNVCAPATSSGSACRSYVLG